MSQYNTPAYEIERGSGRCALTGRALTPGETYIATLVEVDALSSPDAAAENQTPTASSSANPNSAVGGLGLRRLDVSLQAWEENQRPPRLFSHWRTVVPHPNEKKKLFVDDGVLMNLFARLADTTQPDRLAFRFVLGLILMRKKMLRYDRSQQQTDQAGNPVEVWRLTPKLDVTKGPMGKWNEEEQLTLFNPHLDDAAIAQVTQQLTEILHAEL